MILDAWPNAVPTLGRRMIMTDAKEITRDNIVEIVRSAFLTHQENVREELFLFEYERGNQEILKRKKEIRPEINAKVVVNNAAKIVDTHVGYCFSNPITLVQRAKIETDKNKDQGKEDDMKIALLNKMMYEQGKGKKDMELARNLFICGVGYQMVLPTRQKYKNRYFSPFEILVPNPVTTFVVYSNDAYREPLLGCTYSIHSDGMITLTAYSEKWCFEIEREDDDSEFRLAQGLKNVITPNVLGMIPIVEFALNDRMGIFEKAIPILDAINLIDSDRINDIMQFVQSLLWMHNCQIDEDAKKNFVNGGVIMTKSNGDGKEAKITYLNGTLNEAEVQELVDHLIESLEQITATPSWKEASGGSTTGAMQLSNGWQCLEISAKSIEQLFTEGEQQLLDVAIHIINADQRPYDGLKDIQLADIEVRFCRTKTYDLVSKTNALVSLINAGVDGLTAFNTVGLFTDAQQAYIDSARIIDGIQENMLHNTSSNNAIKNANASVDENGFGGKDNEEKDPTEESLQPSRVSGVVE
jgi:SPP1 family phage portal protein